ncbi:MAG: N-formylglutamate amidohydrolase, partial [Cyanobacteriota bacterium]
MENTLRDKIITLDTLKDSLLNNHCLEGKSELGSARIKFSQMAPYIVLCQHSGTFISENIVKKMSVSSDIRSYETDMYLDQLCNEQPIEIIAVHSRYEFDTNRFEKGCIYSKPSLAWGVKVYNETLNQDEISTIISKYREFYTYINLIITSIIDKYGVCVIYDLHSFNETHPDRLNKDLPLINLGTMAQNTEK